MKEIIEFLKSQPNREVSMSSMTYEVMESQSGFWLPGIYKPYNFNDIGHWHDRGEILDYVYSTDLIGKVVLDFGPGDGWPLLHIADFAKKVYGVESSRKRYNVCLENSRKLAKENVKILHVPDKTPLPFDDNFFDSITCASSIEQSSDIFFTLKELYRVLKPNGKMRIHYESLRRYKNNLQDYWFLKISDNFARAIFFDRNIQTETCDYYFVDTNLSETDFDKLIKRNRLEDFSRTIKDIRFTQLYHPSGNTLIRLLSEIGFSKCFGSYSSGNYARMLYNSIHLDNRPNNLSELDDLIQYPAQYLHTLRAVIEPDSGFDPKITAIK